MRAGKLDREITVQRSTSTVNDAGTPVTSWADVAAVRAQLVQQNTEEFIRGFGASDETVVIFRIRWLDGLTNADRIVYGERIHNLKEIKEIGRRNGQELRCIASGGTQ